MNRKEYKRPMAEVVILHQQSHLLSDSQPKRKGVQDYVWNDYEEE